MHYLKTESYQSIMSSFLYKSNMKAEIHNNLSKSLKKDWERLWKTSKTATVVNSPYWFIASCTAYPNTENKIIAIYDGKKLTAISALSKIKLFGINFWTTPASEFADRQSLLFDAKNKKGRLLLIKELKKLGNVHLVGLTEETKKMLVRNLKGAMLSVDDYDPYSFISENPYGDLQKRHRVNIVNRLAKSDKEAVFEYSRYDHEVNLSKAYQIELTSSKNEHGKSVFDRSDARAFYSSFASIAPENIAVSMLSFGKNPVAYCIGFICRNTFFASQKAHFSDYNYYNPGKALMIKMLEYWHGEGLAEFSHGRGVDRFKLTFTKNMRPIYSLTYSKSLLTLLYLNKASKAQKNIYSLISNNHKLYTKYQILKKSILERSHQKVK